MCYYFYLCQHKDDTFVKNVTRNNPIPSFLSLTSTQKNEDRYVCETEIWVHVLA